MNSLIFYTLTILIFLSSAIADKYPYKSSFYGCPRECETQRNPKCEIDLPEYFVALHPNYFTSKVDGNYKYCSHYYIGMIIDKKADGKYKMIRGQVVDQCGSCAETQVDLNQPLFAKIADTDHGIVEMIYVILTKDNKLLDGPIYSGSAVERFAKSKNLSKSDVIKSFVEGAKKMNSKRISYQGYPSWLSGASVSDDDYKPAKVEEHHSKKTTTKRRTTTKVHSKTAKTTKIHHKSKTTKPVVISKTSIITKPTTAPKTPVSNVPSVPKVPVSNVPGVNAPVSSVPKSVTVAVPKSAPKTVSTKPAETAVPKPTYEKTYETERDTDKESGSTLPVTAGIIGCTVGAAGLGLLFLKKKNPQKYNDLKQKFPEAFTTVKRSLSQSATTIKRGVSRTQRSLSRRGNQPAQQQPMPASYSFTLNSEDGLPRVALYDDPYPTRTNSGNQHW